jgi:hypothetical protein
MPYKILNLFFTSHTVPAFSVSLGALLISTNELSPKIISWEKYYCALVYLLFTIYCELVSFILQVYYNTVIWSQFE